MFFKSALGLWWNFQKVKMHQFHKIVIFKDECFAPVSWGSEYGLVFCGDISVFSHSNLGMIKSKWSCSDYKVYSAFSRRGDIWGWFAAAGCASVWSGARISGSTAALCAAVEVRGRDLVPSAQFAHKQICISLLRACIQPYTTNG